MRLRECEGERESDQARVGEAEETVQALRLEIGNGWRGVERGREKFIEGVIRE